MDVQSNGLFISFEGPDAAGKSTQIRLLANYFNKLNYQNIVTRDPGGTAFGQKIRKILLAKETNVAPITELLLYAADRSQHVYELIKPSLDKGIIVICDRYIDSSVAYQGYGRQIPVSLINHLNNIATNKLIPDITFLLDIDTDISLRRRDSSNLDRLESESSEFHKRVRQGYLKTARLYPQRIHIINARKPISVMHHDIKHILREKFKTLFSKNEIIAHEEN